MDTPTAHDGIHDPSVADETQHPSHPPHALGAAGEAAAARWLIRRGWRVLAVRWRGGGGEIDIVAERRGVVAACEVKTRTSADPHAPPIAPAQRRRLAGAAQAWLARHPQYADHAVRPDLIVVVPRGPTWSITRVEGIGPDDYPNRVGWSP